VGCLLSKFNGTWKYLIQRDFAGNSAIHNVAKRLGSTAINQILAELPDDEFVTYASDPFIWGAACHTNDRSECNPQIRLLITRFIQLVPQQCWESLITLYA